MWDAAQHDLWRHLDTDLPAPEPRWTGPSTGLACPLPVEALALGAVAAAAGAAGHRAPEIDPARVGSSFRADQLLRVDATTPGGFAPLSGFWPAADGWVRTHANYPHHRARLLAALGVPDDGLAAAIAARPAHEVEELVVGNGGIAVAVRDRPTWAATDQGRAVAAEPLVAVQRAERPGPDVVDPRVLDLTRVIAGPVATRTLALTGADVLRVDPPSMPELPAQHVDTGLGKRTTVLDAADPRLRELADTADVVVTGYRPGALARFGLAPADLLARRPELVVVTLDAWGWTGPWAGRRGFDSIVQAASGIAVACGTGERPGALPAQALDHATGYLAAASALLGLAERSTRGGSIRSLSLARTAEWLWAHPELVTDAPPVEPVRQTLGTVEVPPPVFGGTWAAPAHELGSDPAVWRQV
ncbi:CoA transferase [Actinomycetospora sp. NBRC 106378]|uniref:CoA transferase n=1 Tax=Actinomycetospora sp. NBRC 106378 TaxID=3032208 RepID=UPI0024A06F5D|nr:CoA transferase [Actinomycetospora sp. NBRC 106378]GLZ54765.1 putative L-carnitine dehydratase [Actinomycetospora sp. NBRC 106378]